MSCSEEAATASVDVSHAIARSAVQWTVCELFAAIALATGLGWLVLKSLHQQIGANASEVARVVKAVASGNLTVSIAAQSVLSGSVMAIISSMQHALHETVSRVLSFSSNLANGSHEIATGNDDLCRRAEQQATALERTTAKIEQMGSTIRHNADSLTQASAVATRGGAVVGQAAQAMGGINDSSREIADIIGVTDSVVFQTNILALNAAVEAARVGDQGRGFAVLAPEVRDLAQRFAASGC